MGVGSSDDCWIGPMKADNCAKTRIRTVSRTRLVLVCLAALLAVALAGMLPAIWVYAAYQDAIYSDPTEVPTAPVAIVFGAGRAPDAVRLRLFPLKAARGWAGSNGQRRISS